MSGDTNRNQNNNRDNRPVEVPVHEQSDYRDYSNVHERVEETDSTKNPPRER